ncbi:hypothetical protein [Streptomyces sp. NPDC058739]|uniref:hypothetical protein n=1 Tax=Streptomyces sp. NPDC058739 TaxID=3346618 RepID=UPI0036CACCD6
MAAISVVLDHTTATALYDPKDPFNEAVAAFYVQASGRLGNLSAPVLSLTAGDAERPGLLSYVKGLPSTPSTPPDPQPHTRAAGFCSL